MDILDWFIVQKFTHHKKKPPQLYHISCISDMCAVIFKQQKKSTKLAFSTEREKNKHITRQITHQKLKAKENVKRVKAIQFSS